MNLYDNLVKYSKDDYYPMHMPGHKRNTKWNHMINPYEIDITEIEDFDNLHHPNSVLYEGMLRAARLYGSKHTEYLINGSTAGLLAGITACTRKGDKVLVARNSHKAVYNAIYLNELKPVYLYPQKDLEFGINCGLNPSAVEELLIEHTDIKLVIITSPTYEGIITDISAIAAIAHKKGIPLLVDEAHGAHLGFHQEFPQNSIKCGADIVIHSLHKTLPSFTQTGLIHVNGNLVDYDKVKWCLSIYQSSSPSYLLMSSIEKCITLMADKGEELFESYRNNLKEFYTRMEQLKKIKILNPFKNNKFYRVDPSKVTISVKSTNITGVQLYELLLEQYKIQMELVSVDYVLGMTSICDTIEGFYRLGDALLHIDDRIEFQNKEGNKGIISKEEGTYLQPKVVMSSYESLHSPIEKVLFSESNDRISVEYIYLYPPGIPLLVPGERISQQLIYQIKKYQEVGLNVLGTEDTEVNYIKVVKN